MRPLWQEVTRERQGAPLTCWMKSARPHKELGQCWLLLEVRAGRDCCGMLLLFFFLACTNWPLHLLCLPQVDCQTRRWQSAALAVLQSAGRHARHGEGLAMLVSRRPACLQSWRVAPLHCLWQRTATARRLVTVLELVRACVCVCARCRWHCDLPLTPHLTHAPHMHRRTTVRPRLCCCRCAC